MSDWTIELSNILDEYVEEVQQAVMDAANEAAGDMVKTLKSTSPKGAGKKRHYAAGWRKKKTGEHQVTVYNATKPGLTHLLNNGHVVYNQYGGGTAHGRVAGDGHITAAATTANEAFLKKVEEKLS